MCWNAEASLVVAGVGLAATVMSARRGDPVAVWGTVGYFTGMELLQAAGYLVINDCGNPMNRGITMASYLHIALQPLILNAFFMALTATSPSPQLRRRIYAFAGVATAIMLFRMLPVPALANVDPGKSCAATNGAWSRATGTLPGKCRSTISGDHSAP